jgi:hypothetical protein
VAIRVFRRQDIRASPRNSIELSRSIDKHVLRILTVITKWEELRSDISKKSIREWSGKRKDGNGNTKTKVSHGQNK